MIPEETGQDVPYYQIEVAVKLSRTGNWSEYAEKQPVQVRGMSMTVPRDQLQYDIWKQAFGAQALAAALSAAVAELRQNQTPQIVGAAPPGVG